MKSHPIQTQHTRMPTTIKSAQLPTETRLNSSLRTTKLGVEAEVDEVARLQIKVAHTKLNPTKMMKAMI